MSSKSASTNEEKASAKEENIAEKLKDSWAIRPCFLYKEEYDDCTSIKARFHQYFIHGESVDCSQWQNDFENCVKYIGNKDDGAGLAVIQSEEVRRLQRLKPHFGNDVWKKRSSPPQDWNKPLPDWLVKKNENTFLELKSKELSDPNFIPIGEKKFCVIM